MATPADRDRARHRVRSLTAAAAGVAGVLTLAGAAAAAGTFAGRTVSSPTTDSSSTPTTDGSGALQPPALAPGDGSLPAPVGQGGAGLGGGISSGGS